MSEPLGTLISLNDQSMRGTSDVFAFGRYTVISGHGGLFGHAHSVEQVEITSDLRALGAVFAFTQTQVEHLHAHGGVYYVKKPSEGDVMLRVFQFVHGASVQTRVLNRCALHWHPIYVIYTPSANHKRHRKHGRRSRARTVDGQNRRRHGDCGTRDASSEYDELVDIGKAMASHAYQTERYATPVIDVDVCGRCSKVRKKSKELSHALLVFR
jgi:hypothetical protein